MLDLMTDKAAVTIPAPKAGKVVECRGKEGEMVKVGSVLVVIDTADSQSKVNASVSAGAGHDLSSMPTLSQDLISQSEASSPKPAHQWNNSLSASDFSPSTSTNGGKKLAAPATRRLARELGVDLTQVHGTGEGGRVTSEDVKNFKEKKVLSQESAQISGVNAFAVNVSEGKEERVPLRGLRKKIAEKMSLSKSKIPHFTYVEELDASELVKLRNQNDEKAQSAGVRLTYLPFIIKAVVLALKAFPFVNSQLDEEKQEVVLKKEYNIGIAAAAPDGLTVPVLKHADQKSLLQIGKEINELGDKARSGKLTLDELHGSTFTITSLGPLGGIFATPIINYPEAAILGVHKIHKRPVVKEDQIVIREMMYVSLSFDHRIIDGEVGARFTQQIIDYLQSPSWLLMQ